MLRRKKKVNLKHELLPMVAPADDDGSVDVTKVRMVTGLMPVAGIMQNKKGDIIPAVFVRVDSYNNEGEEFTETFSFNPMALASSANLLSAVSLLVISDPEVIVKEVTQQAGLKPKEAATKGFNGYL